MRVVFQSLYENVENEINTLRSRHLDKLFMFVGDDGLAIIRLNYVICDHPELYQDSAPFIILVQGESPHGVYHLMHAGWRLDIRLIQLCAEMKFDRPRAIPDDPPVKVFNTALYFLWRMTRAASEYLAHTSQTAGAVDLDLPQETMDTCSENIDWQWLSILLSYYACRVLEFKQSVRAGASQRLDVLWRAFFAADRTLTANKTNYVPTATMRIFWSDALVSKLAELYHSMRSIPVSDPREGSMVGWDYVIEWLNAATIEGVPQHVSEERIERCLSVLLLLAHKFWTLEAYTLLANADEQGAYMNDMEIDVGCLKNKFIIYECAGLLDGDT